MPDNFIFCSKVELAAALGFSPHTLKSIRKKFWTEGLEFVRLNSRTIRYNRELCLNWFATRSFPELHQKAIENYLQKLEQDRNS